MGIRLLLRQGWYELVDFFIKYKAIRSLLTAFFLVPFILLFAYESVGSVSSEDKFYNVIQVFEKSYGNTNFEGLLEEGGYKAAIKKGGNNVPRSLAATALVHAFIYRKEGEKKHLEKAIYLIKALIDKYPSWTASLKSPNISFNLAPTTAYNIGLASWLIWDEMGVFLRASVKDILVKESDYMLLRIPASGFINDTKADENAVVPPLLLLTTLLFPDETNAKKWEEQGRCYAYHTITISKDAAYCGQKTITAYDDFIMDNHNINPHPLYMAAPLVLFADAALVYLASGKGVPDELKHNVIPLWEKIKEFLTDDFKWTTHNSWHPTGLTREVSAATYMAVVIGVDKGFERRLIDYKVSKQGGFVEKEVGGVEKLSEYNTDWFNNSIVAKRYVVSFLLHNPSYLKKPPLSFSKEKLLENRLKKLAMDTINKSTGYPAYVDNNGNWIFLSSERSWTAGFLPSAIWRIYENNPTKENLDLAIRITNHYLNYDKNFRGHDQWFRAKPYFLALRIVENKAYRLKLLEHAKTSLDLFYSVDIGAIPMRENGDDVIIDSFMSTPKLLRYAKYYDIEKSHVGIPHKYFFKKDGSTYQSIHFKNSIPYLFHNHQAEKETCWARGLSWAMLGLALRYEELGEQNDLLMLRKTADYWIGNIHGETNFIMLNSIGGSETFKDTSATAIASIALIKLSRFLSKIEGEPYKSMAINSYGSLIDSLGPDGGLKHSYYCCPTGQKMNIRDNELIFGNYYLIWLRNDIAALERANKVKGNQNENHIYCKRLSKII